MNTRIRKHIKRLLLSVLMVISLIPISTWLMYAYGIQTLPDAPPTQHSLPQNVKSLLWFAETGSRELSVQPVTVFDYVTGRNPAHQPGFRIASLAGSQLVPHGQRLRIIKIIALSIWISQHWTAEQTLSAALAGRFMGHGFIGLDQAAQGYFGKAIETLNPAEIALLAGVIRNPGYLDPWCHAENSHEFAQRLLKNYDDTQVYSTTLLPAPQGQCH